MPKTIILLGFLTALFMSIGYLLGGFQGTIIALFIAFFTNAFVYWNSDKMVLSMAKAKIADKEEYAFYYQIVEKLTAKANLPMPALYVIQNDIPNAFATGRNPSHASIAVNTGILKLLNQEELEGVLAHEIGHIKNYDILIISVVAVLVGAISMIGNLFMLHTLFGANREENNQNNIMGLLLVLIAPLGAAILQFAISREREYRADKFGGELCGNPLFLANALNKLEIAVKDKVLTAGYTVKPSKALLPLYIVNPLVREGDSLFSTHPSTNNRIMALNKLATIMGISPSTINALPEASYNASNSPAKSTDTDLPDNPWI